MKKLLTSFFLLFSLFLFSQEYQFDFLLKSNLHNLDNGFQIWSDYFVNSNDKRYYGRFLTYFDKKNLEFVVSDYKNNIIVSFSIDANADPLNAENYKFLNNGVINTNSKAEKEFSEFYYKQTLLKSINDGKQVIIEKFKNKNSTKKKPLEEMTADLVSCDADLRVFSIHHNFGDTIPFIHLEEKENFYIKHAEIHNKKLNGEYNLEILKINLKLKVNPNDLKFPKDAAKTTLDLMSELKNFSSNK